VLGGLEGLGWLPRSRCGPHPGLALVKESILVVYRFRPCRFRPSCRASDAKVCIALTKPYANWLSMTPEEVGDITMPLEAILAEVVR
jgi:hypothetical protein